MFRNREVFMIYYLEAIKSPAGKMKRQCLPVNPMLSRPVNTTITECYVWEVYFSHVLFHDGIPRDVCAVRCKHGKRGTRLVVCRECSCGLYFVKYMGFQDRAGLPALPDDREIPDWWKILEVCSAKGLCRGGGRWKIVIKKDSQMHFFGACL